MKRKSTLDRIEFDNETYELLCQIRSDEVAVDLEPMFGEAQSELMLALQVAAEQERRNEFNPFVEYADESSDFESEGSRQEITYVWLH